MNNNNRLDLKNGFILALIVTLIGGFILFEYNQYVESENLKSQIYSSLRKADSLIYARSYEEAINEYQSILKTISYQKFPVEYTLTQNSLGIAYGKLSDVRDKESNLEKAINAFQEALKMLTIKSYPVGYATTQSNLGIVYGDLADVSTSVSNPSV